jgi:ectoine hydroxylase-related dioxygenase (phytanoyl-CoA dioxygenase family)
LLTDTEIARFSEDGFVILHDVFAPSEVEALIRATEDPVIQQDLEVRQASKLIAHVLELTTKHPAFKELARDSRLTRRVARLIGNDIQLQHSKLATKPRQKGAGEFPWHQDFARFPHTNYDLVAVNVMLDDTTPENGGMYALKGSHKLGLRNHIQDGWMIGPCYETELWEKAPEKIVRLMAPAGGIIIHHCLLLHFSPPTNSGMQRRMIALEYRAGNAVQLANNVWADTGFQVHGRSSNRVKCAAMDMELPRDPLWLRYCGEAHGTVFNQIGPVARAWNAEIETQQEAASTPS